MTAGPIHAFLAGIGRDGAGRRLSDVLAFDEARIEGVHDFIQWCFPLREASRAVAGAPVLTRAEAEAIRADPVARAGLLAGRDRMMWFYATTTSWLRAHDHNHLRITRILHALRHLLGPEEARAFHAFVRDRNAEAGGPVNANTLDYWAKALAGD
ncbi:opioid growth factor receptor-related protein [Methylobacterium gossipiicola]|uniref:Opioid growth factor receptor (OGFr) conserved region n=1 Tax=Methylobacterium gossipiicola TaxID=582675 RepID=A0A1I2QGY0_9HYPH|nr:opioid growth factor receptor-related protein [Methylobacterium gossipiicola]SFG27230.1 Opioid growth factor receptor (OGFr) conserved region [Methylobacterium gossipiicola]